MALLPLFNKANDQNFVQMQTRWKAILDPLLLMPILNGVQLNNVILATGVNNIPHTLGSIQRGWFITDQAASAAIYRSQPFNNKVLTLTSSAPVTVSLWVY